MLFMTHNSNTFTMTVLDYVIDYAHGIFQSILKHSSYTGVSIHLLL